MRERQSKYVLVGIPTQSPKIKTSKASDFDFNRVQKQPPFAFYKEVLLKTSQNSRKNTSVGASFLLKMQTCSIPLKTSENLWFSDVSRGYRTGLQLC